MGGIQGYLGDSPQRFINILKQEKNSKTTLQDKAVLAFNPDPLSAIGEQNGLFSSPDGQCMGVFSGKIFNYSQLIADFPLELTPEKKLGLLLQNLYRQHSSDFPSSLDGFFSLIMVVDGKLHAARDAIGERPLYVMPTLDGIVVANKMSTLIQHPDCLRKIDPGAISDFLSCGFLPFTRTPVAKISKIPPGSTLIANSKEFKIHNYHNLNDEVQLTSERDCIDSIKSALQLAIDHRFEAGQKTALLLSGGLDSSLVGALLGREKLDCAFSLNFGDQYRHELEFSGLMAKHIGIPAKVITVTPAMIKDKFADTAEILDEPIGDPLTIPNIIVAEAAAKEAQVVFNGEGGDPVFGGPKNQPIMAFEAYGRETQGLSREQLYLRSYNKGHEYLSTVLLAEFTHQLSLCTSTAELIKPYLNDHKMRSYLHQLMHINLRLKGASQILPKVYKASVAAGFAIRSPLFDRNLAELAFQMPASMKLKGPIEKYVLKQAVADIVPEVILSRPKSGMLVPVHFWFRKELKSFTEEVLLDSSAKIGDIIKRKSLENLINFKGGGVKPYYGDRLWLLLSLEFWMQAHDISTSI